MSLESLKALLPDYAKDLKLNLSALDERSSRPMLPTICGIPHL